MAPSMTALSLPMRTGAQKPRVLIAFATSWHMDRVELANHARRHSQIFERDVRKV